MTKETYYLALEIRRAISRARQAYPVTKPLY
jgi:hypothetical protein